MPARTPALSFGISFVILALIAWIALLSMENRQLLAEIESLKGSEIADSLEQFDYETRINNLLLQSELATADPHGVMSTEIRLPGEGFLRALQSDHRDSVWLALRVLRNKGFITEQELASVDFEQPVEKSRPAINQIASKVQKLRFASLEDLDRAFDDSVQTHSPIWPDDLP
ncbi:MAG: hypothetical protein HKN23_06265 [Verrucomicrobiales bacterium]|nr:hypothetical protein [Verrucomicrobiales bacterium]